jgi:hypothetical protein
VQKRPALEALEQIGALGETLALVLAGERIELRLGAERARHWAAAIAAPATRLSGRATAQRSG